MAREPTKTSWTGDELYVRSARGPANGWHVRGRCAGADRIRPGGPQRHVVFAEAAPDVHAGYHAKHHRYGPAIVGSVEGKQARDVTVGPPTPDLRGNASCPPSRP